jgi:glucosylceramidase
MLKKIRAASIGRTLISISVAILITVGLCACASGTGRPAKGVRGFVSGQALEFNELRVFESDPSKSVFKAESEAVGPALEGFGGAFNEKGWEALGRLKPAEREKALRRIFLPGEGLSLGLCRIPIGSSDYAFSRYSLAERPGDLTMESFSIERDRQALLPYIKAAQALNPGLRFWASAWSPPAWMKDNGSSDSGRMLDDPDIYAAYALYLAKFAEAYKAEGVPIMVLAVQNEPSILTAYPSCQWLPDQYRTFVRDHLGPLLASRAPSVGIMLGTFNQPDNLAHAIAVLDDPAARSFVDVLGLQWDGLPIAEAARRILPGLPVWHTETDCGNHHWEPGFDPDKPQNDFNYALYTWRKMRDYLNGGASLYSLWNIVLDQEGKSIDSQRPWPQNSPIVADSRSGQAIYTPMYYAFAHFSRYLPAGSRRLSASGSQDAIAFLLPDGKSVLVTANAGLTEKRFRFTIRGRAMEAVLPPRSFATILVDQSK